MLLILTDRRTEYWSQREHHEDQLYLAVENVDLDKTRAKSPETTSFELAIFVIAWPTVAGQGAARAHLSDSANTVRPTEMSSPDESNWIGMVAGSV